MKSSSKQFPKVRLGYFTSHWRLGRIQPSYMGQRFPSILLYIKFEIKLMFWWKSIRQNMSIGFGCVSFSGILWDICFSREADPASPNVSLSVGETPTPTDANIVRIWGGECIGVFSWRLCTASCAALAAQASGQNGTPSSEEGVVFLAIGLWAKQCHKTPMTGNGSKTTHRTVIRLLLLCGLPTWFLVIKCGIKELLGASRSHETYISSLIVSKLGFEEMIGLTLWTAHNMAYIEVTICGQPFLSLRTKTMDMVHHHGSIQNPLSW